MATSQVFSTGDTSIGHPGEDLGYAYPQIMLAETGLNSWRHIDGGAEVSQREIDFFALRAGLRLMNMVIAGGRDVFEKGIATGVLPASAGAHFSQRLLHRVASGSRAGTRSGTRPRVDMGSMLFTANRTAC